MTHPSRPGPIVGIIGGGQLARMLAEAASPLGVRVRVLASPADEGADGVVVDLIQGDPDDREAITAFAKEVDVLTIDHENVDWETLADLEDHGVLVWPSVETLQLSDKAYQRRTFANLGLPVPDFAVVEVDDRERAVTDALAFTSAHGDSERRIVAKASRGGYDGRGVWVLSDDEIPAFLDSYQGAPLVLEPLLDLEMEMAVLLARNPSGQVEIWPVLETVQVDGMCDEVIMPARISKVLADEAVSIARSIARLCSPVGVLAVELFQSGGRLLINEIAPRVHNSGHLTIEANSTSQFAQHLRAILDWPLGPTEPRQPAAVMHNVVGDSTDPRSTQRNALRLVPEAHLHLYGKSPRPGRKVGHVTVLGDNVPECRDAAELAARVLTDPEVEQNG